jgi:hypothetical protein
MRSSRLLPVFAAALALSLGLAPTPSAQAGKSQREAAERLAESSLLVGGTIDIAADGKVVGYKLDNADKLPKAVLDMVARHAPHWKFDPIALPEGTHSRSPMSLLFVAKKREDGNFALELRGASFEADVPEAERVSIARRGRMPAYPDDLAARGINGTVYLSVRIGRDGKVMDIDASHVNLRTIGSESEMANWREQFRLASIKAVRGWSFKPPSAGAEVDAPYWTGTLPVAFTVMGYPEPKPDQWETYIPGPRKPIPWVDSLGMTAEHSDALAPNRFHTPGQGRRLLTPLGEG